MGSGLISIRIQQKTYWNNGFTLRDYYTADYIGDSDTPDSYTDTLTETTTGDYSYSLNGWDKHEDTNANLYWSDNTNVSLNESFQSHTVHVWSSDASLESATGTQSGHGDAVDGYSYSSNVPSPDGYYKNHHYEDHYTFTGTLNGSTATIVNYIHGSKHNDATGEQPVDDSYSDTQTYSGTLTTRPGFGSGTGTNGNHYPFTGIASGGRFSDAYWQPLAPSSGGTGGNSSSVPEWDAKVVAKAYNDNVNQTTQKTNNWAHRPGDGTWTAGSYLDPNFHPMGRHPGIHYGGVCEVYTDKERKILGFAGDDLEKRNELIRLFEIIRNMKDPPFNWNLEGRCHRWVLALQDKLNEENIKMHYHYIMPKYIGWVPWYSDHALMQFTVNGNIFYVDRFMNGGAEHIAFELRSDLLIENSKAYQDYRNSQLEAQKLRNQIEDHCIW